MSLRSISSYIVFNLPILIFIFYQIKLCKYFTQPAIQKRKTALIWPCTKKAYTFLSDAHCLYWSQLQRKYCYLLLKGPIECVITYFKTYKPIMLSMLSKSHFWQKENVLLFNGTIFTLVHLALGNQNSIVKWCFTYQKISFIMPLSFDLHVIPILIYLRSPELDQLLIRIEFIGLESVILTYWTILG